MKRFSLRQALFWYTVFGAIKATASLVVWKFGLPNQLPLQNGSVLDYYILEFVLLFAAYFFLRTRMLMLCTVALANWTAGVLGYGIWRLVLFGPSVSLIGLLLGMGLYCSVIVYLAILDLPRSANPEV